MLANSNGTWIKIVIGVSYLKEELSDPDVLFIVAMLLAVAYEFFKGLRRVYAHDRGEEESFVMFLRRFSQETGQGGKHGLRVFFRHAHARLVTTRARVSEVLSSRRDNKA